MTLQLVFRAPAGWIELAAFASDDAAAAWFDRLIAVTPDFLDDEGWDRLRALFIEARAQIANTEVDAAGAVVTSLLDDTVTLWQFTVRVRPTPNLGDLSTMALAQRYLEAGGNDELVDGDFIEAFTTDDGRNGVAVHTRTRPVADDAAALALSMGRPVDELGVVYAVIELPMVAGDPTRRLGTVTAVAPTLGERSMIGLIAANLTVSLAVREVDHDLEAPVWLDPADVTR